MSLKLGEELMKVTGINSPQCLLRCCSSNWMVSP